MGCVIGGWSLLFGGYSCCWRQFNMPPQKVVERHSLFGVEIGYPLHFLCHHNLSFSLHHPSQNEGAVVHQYLWKLLQKLMNSSTKRRYLTQTAISTTMFLAMNRFNMSKNSYNHISTFLLTNGNYRLVQLFLLIRMWLYVHPQGMFSYLSIESLYIFITCATLTSH